ncbi:MAG: (2Fe-2S) ferredoxin domain-containing protein [Oscillospiraceae bacterium]|jgi:NADP-reducing hydrogenase subunit HndB|nr:(2Fe-2S) ferredoxin domain-containing protein [Oscillospiraceae bacterium]
MKSLAELQALRDEMKTKIGVRKDGGHRMRVVVGMATCGIAAGARPVFAAFIKEIETRKLTDVVVAQTGCIGICQFEPVVEIYGEGGEKTTYVYVTPEKVPRIVAQHVVNGTPVVEYTIGANAK